MSIKKYWALVKTVELGSLTKAAQELGYTQSGVSHMINSLEEEMGFSILVRNRAGIKLTENGEKILPAIRGILNCNEQLNQIIAGINGLNFGTVRIGTFTSVAVHWLPGMIKSFQKDYPMIEFKLLNGDYHDVETWLCDGSVDMGFVAMPCSLGCELIPLKEDRLMAIVPENHRFAALPKFPLSEIEDEDFISLMESSDHDARRALEAAGVHPNVKFMTKDDYAIIAMVENGLGISIMPELLLKGRTDKVRVMELAPGAKRMIGLAIPAVGRASPATSSFADHVCRWVKENF